jgi:hypothetical protein
MTRAPHFVVNPGGEAARNGEPPGREFQELWFSLAHRTWASVVLVPADSGGSAEWIAKSLADVGSRLRDTPVTAIVASSVDYSSARALVEMQPRIQGAGVPEAAVRTEPAAAGTASPVSAGDAARDATLPAPPGRAVIAIQPVVVEPLGIAVARAADGVVLCVELGNTRLSSARRTIELIGPERFMGVFVVR